MTNPTGSKAASRGGEQAAAARYLQAYVPVAHPPQEECSEEEQTQAHLHIAKAYEVSDDPTIVVVRPDEFIGAIVKNVNGTEKYFKRVFA